MAQYATVNQTIIGLSENTASIKWTADAVIDYIWFSSDNGITWTGLNIADGTGGSYVINGLSANSTYYVKTRVRKKDTQFVSDSTALPVTTYDYPHAVYMPSFRIGESVSVGLYNPLGRSCRVAMIGANGSVVRTELTTGQFVSGWNDAQTVINLYASIPSAQSGVYSVKVTQGIHEDTKTGGSYRVNPQDCSPVIGTVSYADVNADTLAITGDDQDVVQSKSLVAYSASGLSAKLGASISSVTVLINGDLRTLTVSGATASGGSWAVNSSVSVPAVFTVTDSRGLKTSNETTLHMLPWYDPSVLAEVARQGGVDTATDLKAEVLYAPLDNNNQITITYEATKDGDSTPTVSGTLQNGTVSVVNLDNSYAWTVSVTAEDLLDGSVTATVEIPRGTPVVFFDRMRSSVGVNCFPSDDGVLEVVGDIIVNGKKLVFNSDNTVTWQNA